MKNTSKKAAAFAALGIALVGAAALEMRARNTRGIDDSGAPVDLPAVKDAYEHTHDVGRRTALLRRASKLSDPAVVPWLAGIAQSDPAMATQASTALGAVSDRAAGSDLLQIVTGSAPTLVRANSARALGQSGGPREAAALAATIRDASQPLRVRQEAALALGKIGDPSIVPTLIATVEQAAQDTTVDGEQLRISMVQALGELRSGDAREFLQRYARGRLSPTERAFVSRALSRSS